MDTNDYRQEEARVEIGMGYPTVGMVNRLSLIHIFLFGHGWNHPNSPVLPRIHGYTALLLINYFSFNHLLSKRMKKE